MPQVPDRPKTNIQKYWKGFRPPKRGNPWLGAAVVALGLFSWGRKRRFEEEAEAVRSENQRLVEEHRDVIRDLEGIKAVRGRIAEQFAKNGMRDQVYHLRRLHDFEFNLVDVKISTSEGLKDQPALLVDSQSESTKRSNPSPSKFISFCSYSISTNSLVPFPSNHPALF